MLKRSENNECLFNQDEKETIKNQIDNIKSVATNQQSTVSAFASIATLLKASFENRTEVVTYRQLPHDELVNVAVEYDDMLAHLENVVAGFEETLDYTGMSLGNIRTMCTDLKNGLEVRR